MIALKPIFLWKYLGFKRNKLPENVGRLFYLSWEDALWDILEKKHVKKGSVVLVPEFFCGDVENNIKSHGYKITYYPVSKKLKTTKKQLISTVKKFHPKIIVIHHHAGIYNSLLRETGWLKYLKDDVLLIEDCVHRIVEPSQIKFIKKNHFIIDSLRKVVPLQGSVVYGQKRYMNFQQPPFYQSLLYSLKVHVLYLLMNLSWSLGIILPSFSYLAEGLMKKGYDLIGDSKKSAPGFFIFDTLRQFLDIEKIKKIKDKQVNFYQNKFINMPKYLQIPPFKKEDRRELIGFPLFIDNKSADKFICSLRKKGLLVRAELADSQWSIKQKIIYLPLGPHITEDHLKFVFQAINQLTS